MVVHPFDDRDPRRGVEHRVEVGQGPAVDGGDRAAMEVEADDSPEHRFVGDVDGTWECREHLGQRPLLLGRHQDGAEPPAGPGHVDDHVRALRHEEAGCRLHALAELGIVQVDVVGDPGILGIGDVSKIVHRCACCV